MNLVNSSFSSLSDAELENSAQNIFVQLSNKSVFPTPFADLDALGAAVTAYSEALAQSIDGGRAAIAKKNATRKVLEKLLKKASVYVALMAGDDLTIIAKSGFQARKPRSSRPAITTPENIQAESGLNSGELMVSVNAVDDVKTYHFEYTTDDPISENCTWITEPDTRSWHTIAGLKPGQKYWLRVAAIGLRGAKAYSNVVFCFVQ